MNSDEFLAQIAEEVQVCKKCDLHFLASMVCRVRG